MRSLRILLLVDGDCWYPSDPDYKGLLPESSNNMEFHIAKALRKHHRVQVIPFLNDVARLIRQLTEAAPQLVFNLVQCFENDRRGEMFIPAILEMLHLKYTGPGTEGILLSNDKKVCKDLLAGNGVLVPNCNEVFNASEVKENAFQYPVIVKPNFGGGSDTILQQNIVRTKAQLKPVIRKVLKAGYRSALIETFIPGREIIVAMVGNGKNLKIYPPREIIFPSSKKSGDDIITDDIKSHKKLRKEMQIHSKPLRASSSTLRNIQQIATKTFQLLKLADYARLDLRMDQKGDVYVIDVNANCNLRPGHKSFLKQFGQEPYQQTIDSIVAHAMRRQK